MHGRNWMQGYDEEVARAKDHHQRALQEAHEEFKRACDEAERLRNDAYKQASAAWELVKSFPDHPEHEAAREAFQRAQVAASFTAARRALAEAVRQADEDFQAKMRMIAGRHNVTIN